MCASFRNPDPHVQRMLCAGRIFRQALPGSDGAAKARGATRWRPVAVNPPKNRHFPGVNRTRCLA